MKNIPIGLNWTLKQTRNIHLKIILLTYEYKPIPWFFKGNPKFFAEQRHGSNFNLANYKHQNWIVYHVTYMYKMKCKTKWNCFYFRSIIPTEIVPFVRLTYLLWKRISLICMSQTSSCCSHGSISHKPCCYKGIEIHK